LHLFVTPKGAKVWRLRYKVNGGEQTLVIGPYPTISLADARANRDAAKAALAAGTDPRRINIAATAAPTLIEVAREWHQVNLGLWKPRHAKDVFDRLKSEVLDFKPRYELTTLGDMPIEAVKAPILVEALRQLEARGAIDMAHRIRARLDRVFAFAIGSGKCSVNPAAMIARAMAPGDSVRKRRPICPCRRADICSSAVRFMDIVSTGPADAEGKWPAFA
jgi:hypothetical protein